MIAWGWIWVWLGGWVAGVQYGGSEMELVLVAVEAMGEHLAASPAIVAVIEQRFQSSPQPQSCTPRCIGGLASMCSE
jgi:hypothetical protein